MTAVWPSILGLLKLVRDACNLTNEAVPTLLDITRAAAVALATPAYIAFYRYNGVETRSIPSFVAAMHKMSAGLFGVCKNCLLARVAQGDVAASVTETSASLYRYAEQSGTLLSRTGVEACAGPPALIRDALRVLVHGDDRVLLDMRPAEVIVRSPERLVKYGDAVIDMTILVNIFGACAGALVSMLHNIFRSMGDNAFQLAEPESLAMAYFGDKGFTNSTLSVICSMPDAVRLEYAHGAASLLRSDRAQELRKALTGQDQSTYSQNDGSAPKSGVRFRQYVDQKHGDEMASIICRILSIERNRNWYLCRQTTGYPRRAEP